MSTCGNDMFMLGEFRIGGGVSVVMANLTFVTSSLWPTIHRWSILVVNLECYENFEYFGID